MQANVRDYGAVGNGSTPDTTAITNAMTAVVNNGDGTLFFPVGTYRVDADLTISSTVVAAFEPNGKLSIDSGKVVTIDGPVDAGVYEVFTGR